MIEADVVIVGGGSAGCALAGRLSEDPKIRVVLLEAGPRDTDPWIHLPVGYFRNILSPLSWGFETEPDPGMNGRSIVWPRGKVLGGSSSINGLIYIRARPRTTTTGASWAMPAGPSPTCCPTSSVPRTRSAARANSTASADHSAFPT